MNSRLQLFQNHAKIIGLNETTAVKDTQTTVFLVESDTTAELNINNKLDIDKATFDRIVSVFKTPIDFNWAWLYFSEENEAWIQFDCPDCLQLEFNFQAYKLSRNNDFKSIENIRGTVNLDTLELMDR